MAVCSAQARRQLVAAAHGQAQEVRRPQEVAGAAIFSLYFIVASHNAGESTPCSEQYPTLTAVARAGTTAVSCWQI